MFLNQNSFQIHSFKYVFEYLSLLQLSYYWPRRGLGSHCEINWKQKENVCAMYTQLSPKGEATAAGYGPSWVEGTLPSSPWDVGVWLQSTTRILCDLSFSTHRESPTVGSAVSES